MKSFVCLCFILGFVSATKVKFEDCGSKGTVKFVDVTPCDKQPCTLQLSTNVNVTIGFVSKTASKSCVAVTYGVVQGVPIPFPLPDPDACDNGVKCPVKPGAMNVFSEKVFLESDFPLGNITAKYELKDDNFNDIACVMVPVVLKN